MGYVYIYLFIGFLLCCISYTKDDKRVVTNYPWWIPVMMVIWLPYLIYLIKYRFTYIKYKGEIIWQKKQK